MAFSITYFGIINIPNVRIKHISQPFPSKPFNIMFKDFENWRKKNALKFKEKDALD